MKKAFGSNTKCVNGLARAGYPVCSFISNKTGRKKLVSKEEFYRKNKKNYFKHGSLIIYHKHVNEK